MIKINKTQNILRQKLTLMKQFKNKAPIAEARINGIYWLYKNDEIVYVGKSKNIIKRISEHFDKIDFNYFNYVKICETKSLNNIEAYFIYKLKPKYNKMITINTVGLTKEHFIGELKQPIDLNDNISKYYGDELLF